MTHGGRIRVLVLDQGDGVWGAQRYLLRLAPLLAGRGVDLVLGSPPGLELADTWQAAGRPWVAVALPRHLTIRDDSGRVSVRRASGAATALPAAVRSIRRVARDEHVDVVWANAHWTHLAAALAGRLGGPPVVLHLHEEPVPGVGAALRSMAVLLAECTVAVSRAVGDGVNGPARRRVRVVVNGVDATTLVPGPASPGVRAQLAADPSAPVVVALTRLDPCKRIEDLIDAVAAGDARTQLAVVGSTSGFPDYAADVERRGRAALGDRVRFIGLREDVADVIRAGDVVAHAGVVEGMPLGLLEAQACGVPVVAYAVAGVPDAVDDRVTGVLVPARDVVALGRAIDEVTADADLRERMGRAGRARVERRHSLEHQADANAKILREFAA